jgi:very-short-patch-repair endonuclease
MAPKHKPIEVQEPQVPHIRVGPRVPNRARLRDKFPGIQPKPGVPDIFQDDFFDRYAAWKALPQHAAASIPEFIVYDYLTRRKKWTEGNEFVYQYALVGGRTLYGGYVGDFFIRSTNAVWNIQGLRFHLLNVKDRAKVELQKMDLTKRGFKVLSLWEDDLLERPEYTIEAALNDQETNRHTDDVGLTT